MGGGQGDVMLKTGSAIVAAAVIAAAIVMIPALWSAPAGASEPGRKGDRLDRIMTPDAPPCVARGWPYYSQGCGAHPVRLVNLDRI